MRFNLVELAMNRELLKGELRLAHFLFQELSPS